MVKMNIIIDKLKIIFNNQQDIWNQIICNFTNISQYPDLRSDPQDCNSQIY